MRICDWSSDVCSSDLGGAELLLEIRPVRREREPARPRIEHLARDIVPPRRIGHLLFEDMMHGLRDRGNRAAGIDEDRPALALRSEEHTSELQSLMRISYAVFCLKKKNNNNIKQETTTTK